MISGGATLGTDVTIKPKGISLSFMPDYSQKCRIRFLIMVPIEIWRNSDLFLLKNQHFMAQKLVKLEHISEISHNFIENILNLKRKTLKHILVHYRWLKPFNQIIIYSFLIILYFGSHNHTQEPSVGGGGAYHLSFYIFIFLWEGGGGGDFIPNSS